MDVTDRTGKSQKLTEARYGRFTACSTSSTGWVSRLREDFGPAPPTSWSTTASSRLTPRRTSRDALASLDANGYELAVLEAYARTGSQVVERETGAAGKVIVPG